MRTIPDASDLTSWRRSSYSGSDNQQCVEVADGYLNVPVRDSKNPYGPALVFGGTGWGDFVTAVKRRELDA